MSEMGRKANVAETAIEGQVRALTGSQQAEKARQF
jgi:hypothetical protein